MINRTQDSAQLFSKGISDLKSSGVAQSHVSTDIGTGKDVIAAPAVIKVGQGKNAQTHVIRPGPREINRRLNFPEQRKSGVFGTAPASTMNIGNISDQAGQEAALAVTATSLTGAPPSFRPRVTPLGVVAKIGALGVGLWGVLALL